MFLKNWTMVPKKSPNKERMPTPSTIKPMKECLNKMRVIPPKKKIVGLIFVGLAKKYMVLVGPMIKTTPMTNKMLPIAKRLESKKAKIPRRKKTTPAAVDTTPYFWRSVSHIVESKSMVKVSGCGGDVNEWKIHSV